MVAERDTDLQAFGQSRAEVIILIIINQSAGIHRHAPVLFEHHPAVSVHKLLSGFFGVISGHAVFGDGRCFRV